MEQVDFERCIVRYIDVSPEGSGLEISGHVWRGDTIGCVYCGLLVRGTKIEFVRPIGQRQPFSAPGCLEEK